MISANKIFGSYVLQDVNLLDIAPDHQHDLATSLAFVTKCAIPSEWISLELLEIKKYNHDTSILKFLLPSGRGRLDLPVGSFLLVKAPRSERDGKDAIRPYTSISDDDALSKYFVKDMMNGELEKANRLISCSPKPITLISPRERHLTTSISLLLAQLLSSVTLANASDGTIFHS
jgi:Oxidoreductase FAD-binding domain